MVIHHVAVKVSVDVAVHIAVHVIRVHHYRLLRLDGHWDRTGCHNEAGEKRVALL